MNPHISINHLRGEIKTNLLEGDSVDQAIERPNVRRALEIVGLQLLREGRKPIRTYQRKWLGNMSLTELREVHNSFK